MGMLNFNAERNIILIGLFGFGRLFAVQFEGDLDYWL